MQFKNIYNEISLSYALQQNEWTKPLIRGFVHSLNRLSAHDFLVEKCENASHMIVCLSEHGVREGIHPFATIFRRVSKMSN